MRFTLLLIFVLSFTKISFAQQPAIKYYSKEWKETTKDSAYYRSSLTKKDDGYEVVSYAKESGKIIRQALYDDSDLKKPIGTFRNYYEENGQLEDSTIYDDKSNRKEEYHFYSNGKFSVSVIFAKRWKNNVVIAKDENGNDIPNFTFEIDADYPGGQSAWIRFLAETIDSDVPIRNGAPIGTYTVIVLFVVSPSGDLLNMKPETNFGYGMEVEVIRVLSRSEKWKPAIQLNKFVNAYRRQPITFQVTDK